MTNTKLAMPLDTQSPQDPQQQSQVNKSQYSFPYKILHWAMALVMIALLIAGQQFNFNISDEYRHHGLIFHSSVGTLALIAAFSLLIKRFLLKHHRPESGLPYLQTLSANLVQFALYALAIAIPVTGLLAAYYSPHEVMLFGSYKISLASGETEQAWTTIRWLHRWATRLTMLLLACHAGAALYHHFIVKDDVLRKMIIKPFRR